MDESFGVRLKERCPFSGNEGCNPQTGSHTEIGNVASTGSKIVSKLRIRTPIAHVQLPTIIDLQGSETKFCKPGKLSGKNIPGNVFVVGIPRTPHTRCLTGAATSRAQLLNIGLENLRFTAPAHKPASRTNLIEGNKNIFISAHLRVSTRERANEETRTALFFNNRAHPRTVMTDGIICPRVIGGCPTFIRGNSQGCITEQIPPRGRPRIVPTAVVLATFHSVEQRDTASVNDCEVVTLLDELSIS